MEAQKREEKKDIIVLDEGMEANASGDPVRARVCCWTIFVAIRG